MTDDFDYAGLVTRLKDEAFNDAGDYYDEAADAIERLLARATEAEGELDQMIGISLGLQNDLDAIYSQEPIGEIVNFGRDTDLKECAWRKGRMPPVGTKFIIQPTREGE